MKGTTTRRTFLASFLFTAVSAGLMVVSRLVEGLAGVRIRPAMFEKFRIGAIEEFVPGTVTVVQDRAIAVIREADGSFRAVSATCPHQGCIVDWVSKNGRFECPCHGSKFSRDGALLEGPSTKRLGSKPVEVHADGSVWAAAGWVE